MSGQIQAKLEYSIGKKDEHPYLPLTPSPSFKIICNSPLFC